MRGTSIANNSGNVSSCARNCNVSTNKVKQNSKQIQWRDITIETDPFKFSLSHFISFIYLRAEPQRVDLAHRILSCSEGQKNDDRRAEFCSAVLNAEEEFEAVKKKFDESNVDDRRAEFCSAVLNAEEEFEAVKKKFDESNVHDATSVKSFRPVTVQSLPDDTRTPPTIEMISVFDNFRQDSRPEADQQGDKVAKSFKVVSCEMIPVSDSAYTHKQDSYIGGYERGYERGDEVWFPIDVKDRAVKAAYEKFSIANACVNDMRNSKGDDVTLEDLKIAKKKCNCAYEAHRVAIVERDATAKACAFGAPAPDLEACDRI